MVVSVIVPAKNEPELNEFLFRLHEILETIPEQYEVIVAIGDRETLNGTINHLHHQRVIKTYGDSLERSILGGFSHARGNKIIITDADGCHQIEKIPEIVNHLNKYEMVAATRYLPGGGSNFTYFRSFVSWFFGKWAKLFGSKLSDPMVGFFGVRKEIVDKVKFKPYTWKIPLEIELKAQPTIKEFGAVVTKREVGKSSASPRIALKILWDIMWG